METIKENELVVTPELQQMIIQPVQQPTWAHPPEVFDILATVIIGLLAFQARMLWFSLKNNTPIKWLYISVWSICGVILGFAGGELSPIVVNISTSMVAGLLGSNAPIIDPDSYTWFFALMFGLLGMDFAFKLFGVVGEKAIEKIEKNDLPVTQSNSTQVETVNVYENIPVNPITPPSANPTLDDEYISTNFKWVDVGESLPEDIKQKAQWFAENTLQPIRTAFGFPFAVNSWYRSPAKNASTPGASTTSFHMTAEAVDLDVIGKKNKDLFEYLFANKDKFSFDKVIAEHWNGQDYAWLHIQSRPDKQRKEFYVASGTRDNPIYTPYTG